MIGRAWSVQVKVAYESFRSGFAYHYGVNPDGSEAKPHYPVPALNDLGAPFFDAWLASTGDFQVAEYTSMLARQGYFDEPTGGCSLEEEMAQRGLD